MKKLLLALAIGASISTGASAVTCGENQQPDYTNSYCVDDPQATTTYSSMQDVYNDLDPKEKEEFMKDSCDGLYQTFITQLVNVRSQVTTTCNALCKVRRSSFMPLGPLSRGDNISIKMFNDQLRYIAGAVMLKDPEITSGDSIYFDFLKVCNANQHTILEIFQRVVDLKFGGDVNKFLKYLETLQIGG